MRALIFSEEHFMNLFLSCSFCICSLVLYLIVLWMMSACALLNNGCSSPQKDGCSRPLKIMGARPHFFKRAFHKLYFLHVHLCPFTCALLICLWIMSAHAPIFQGSASWDYFFHASFINHSYSCCCFPISCASYFQPCTYLIVLSIAY